MKSAAYWIKKLQLQKHPEGGFFKETYRSQEQVEHGALPPRFSSTRNFSTSIYFLLREQDKSMFHRIKSDELWHYHDGGSLTLYVLTERGVELKKLGSNPDKDESLQVVIPANCWFGATVNENSDFVLAGCTVSPGFDFHDFELASRTTLLKEFPSHQQLIERLTPSNT